MQCGALLLCIVVGERGVPPACRPEAGGPVRGWVRRLCAASPSWVGVAAVFASHCAMATGVAGDRLFPSTMTIEDTQNDDELALPTIALLKRGAEGDMPAGHDLGIA